MTSSAKQLALSVVVPTYGRSELIVALLDALREQTLDPSRFEVVTVDDGSPEPVVIDASRYPFALELRRQPNAGPAAARNLALEQCRAPLVLILNDDTVPADDLLESHLRVHAEANEDLAVLGTFHFAPEVMDSPFVRLLDRSNLLFDFTGLRQGETHDWRFFWTCNLSLSLAALRRVGGFDAELFHEAIVEDVEIGYRLEKQLGIRVLHRDDLVAYHRHRLTPQGYFDRMIRLGVNLARMWQKHRDPAVLWMDGASFGAFLGLSQLRYEQNHKQASSLVEKLTQLEQLAAGREVPDALLDQLEPAVRRLSLVPFARGIVMEGAGYDPEPYCSAPAPSAGLTSIVIVSYESLAKTRRCLDALRGTADPAYPTEIVVVDNGSRDGSVEFLREQRDVKLIEAGENLGAPAARNRAIPETKGESLVFMDNDAIATTDWLARLHYHRSVDPKAGCVCPLTDRASHGQQIAYEGEDSFASINAFAVQLGARQHRSARYGFLFSSFCVLVRRDVIDRIGGFDERFSPWGFEDDDFSLRVQLAGFRVRVALDVFVRHEAYDGPKLERHEKLLLRNWKRFAKKWGEADEEREYGDYELLQGTLEREWSDRELRVPIGPVHAISGMGE